MLHLSRMKTQGGDRFSRNRPFLAQGRNLWADWSEFPAQKLLARSWTGPENFIKILSFHQKLFNFLIRTDRHTDTQTDRHTDTQTDRHMNPHPYTGGRNFFMPVFDTFHFTTFVKDKYGKIQCGPRNYKYLWEFTNSLISVFHWYATIH